HGALAGLRAGRARLRRPRPAGLPLPRAVVDPARHDDPAADDPGRAPAPGRVLSLPSGTLPRAPRAMPPTDRFVISFAAEPPQEGLPYGRWADTLAGHFLAACQEVDTEGEDIGDPGEVRWF